jgi:hypothetical protein
MMPVPATISTLSRKPPSRRLSQNDDAWCFNLARPHGHADEVAMAGGIVIKALLKTQNGSIVETAALILRQLIPSLLQQDSNRKASKGPRVASSADAVWERMLDFVLEITRYCTLVYCNGLMGLMSKC